MALVLKDRVKETTSTTGTGTLTLGGSAPGFQSFSVIGNSNTTYYAIVDSATGDWEVGVGTYTASGTTLSRTTVLESSNGGSLVNFGSGAKDVFCTYPAERAVTTTDIQTLTGKTITFADNTLTGVQPTLVSGTNIKTINGSSVLGSGNLVVGGGGGATVGQVHIGSAAPASGTWVRAGQVYSKATYPNLATIYEDVPTLGAPTPAVTPTCNLTVGYLLSVTPSSSTPATFTSATNGSITAIGHGSLMTTADGVHYSFAAIPLRNNTVAGVRYLNGYFVAVSTDIQIGRIVYSADGVTWKVSTFPASRVALTQAYNVEYTGTHWVVAYGTVASSTAAWFVVFRSTDLVTWTYSVVRSITAGPVPTAGTPAQIRELRMLNGHLYLATSIGLFRSADGGLTWECNYASPMTALAYISRLGRYYACGATTIISTTGNGSGTWGVQTSNATGSLVGFVESPACVIACSTGGNSSVTAGGTSWSACGVGAGVGTVYTGVTYGLPVYDSTKNLFINAHGNALYTSRITYAPASGTPWDVAPIGHAGSGGIVHLSGSDVNVVGLQGIYSVEVVSGVPRVKTILSDALSALKTVVYPTRTVSQTEVSLRQIVSYNGTGTYVMIDESAVYASTDGDTWVAQRGVNTTTTNTTWASTYFFNGRFIVSPFASGVAYISTNGFDFTASAFSTVAVPVFADDGTWAVAVGTGQTGSSRWSTFASAPTGVNAYGATKNLSCLVAGNGYFVAGGAASEVLTITQANLAAGAAWTVTALAPSGTEIRQIRFKNNRWYLATAGQIFISADATPTSFSTWFNTASVMQWTSASNVQFTDIDLDDNGNAVVVASTTITNTSSWVFFYNAATNTWRVANNSNTSQKFSIAYATNSVLRAMSTYGVDIVSNDGGVTSEMAGAAYTYNGDAVTTVPGSARTSDGRFWRAQRVMGLYWSTDLMTWNGARSIGTAYGSGAFTGKVVVCSPTEYYLTTRVSVFRSTDGFSWNNIPSTFFGPDMSRNATWWVCKDTANNKTYLTATVQSPVYASPIILRSTDGGATWVQRGSIPMLSSPSMTSSALLFANNKLTFIGATTGSTGFALVFTSTDEGATWVSKNAPLPSGAIYDGTNYTVSSATDGTNIVTAFTTTSNSYNPTLAYKTADNGDTWELLPVGGTSAFGQTNTPAGANIQYSNGLWYIFNETSTDLVNFYPAAPDITSFYANDNGYYVGTQTSVNNGGNTVVKGKAGAGFTVSLLPMAQPATSGANMAPLAVRASDNKVLFVSESLGAASMYGSVIMEAPLYNYNNTTSFYIPPMGAAETAWVCESP